MERESSHSMSPIYTIKGNVRGNNKCSISITRYTLDQIVFKSDNRESVARYIYIYIYNTR